MGTLQCFEATAKVNKAMLLHGHFPSSINLKTRICHQVKPYILITWGHCKQIISVPVKTKKLQAKK